MYIGYMNSQWLRQACTRTIEQHHMLNCRFGSCCYWSPLGGVHSRPGDPFKTLKHTHQHSEEWWVLHLLRSLCQSWGLTVSGVKDDADLSTTFKCLASGSALELLLVWYFHMLLVYHCALCLWNVNYTRCTWTLSHPPWFLIEHSPLYTMWMEAHQHQETSLAVDMPPYMANDLQFTLLEYHLHCDPAHTVAFFGWLVFPVWVGHALMSTPAYREAEIHSVTLATRLGSSG